MAHYTLPVKLGEFSIDPALAADVGKVYLLNGKAFRLVKFTTSITAAPCLAVITATAAATGPTWVCTLAGAAAVKVAGIISTVDGTLASGITGSATTTISGTITASSTVPAYGLVCIGGFHQCVGSAALTADLLLTTAAAGQVLSGGTAGTTSIGAVDTASTGAGGAVGVWLDTVSNI